MPHWFIDGAILLGAALMVYNIYGFIRFARDMRGERAFGENRGILHLPVILLIFFLLGYLFVALVGKPDLMVSMILFFGSVFVQIMYRVLGGVTRRIKKSDELEARLLAETEANRTKSAFLATISHEFRTPLNVILGLDHILAREPGLSDDARDKVDKIDFGARHMLDLVNNILDINRMGSGVTEAHRVPFDMRQALEQINAIVQSQCEAKGLAYEFKADEKLAQRYLGDTMLIKQVMLRILDNAVKYTDVGSVRFTVEDVSTPDKPAIRYTVSDTGVGIDPAFLDKVFDAFTREDDSTTAVHGGSGLSMAVTKREVELMGGTIEATSEKGKGATFTVTLPLEVVAQEDSADQNDWADVVLAGRRILIVEDVPENAEIAADLLELEDMESENAVNGAVALDMVRRAPAGYYDAILMDLRMPIMDGLAAARCIRALPTTEAATIPIIALTANAFPEDIQKALDAGMNAHLAKPVDADLLYDTLKRTIADAERNVTK